MTAVALDRATLALGGRAILEDVSLAIEDGEFIAVLGPNGAGKTTLFRALLGLVRPRAGSVSVLGAPARRGSPAIGYLPQVRTFPAAMRITGRDFVASAVGGERWGPPWPTAAARSAVDEALAAVGGEGLAGRPLMRLSGGERQRLTLAQALVGKPRLLLLDEPLISLDPARQDDAVALVGSVARSLGLTVLFSAHEINPLLGAVDRVLYLGGGKAALGTVDAVITPTVLSQLYGAPIEVLRLGGRLLVLSGGQEVERHAHDHHHHGHGHGHGNLAHSRSRPPFRAGGPGGA